MLSAWGLSRVHIAQGTHTLLHDSMSSLTNPSATRAPDVGLGLYSDDPLPLSVSFVLVVSSFLRSCLIIPASIPCFPLLISYHLASFFREGCGGGLLPSTARLSRSLSPSLSPCVSLSLCLSPYLSLSLSVCLAHSLTHSLSRSLTLTHSLTYSLSVSLPLSLSLSLSVPGMRRVSAPGLQSPPVRVWNG